MSLEPDRRADRRTLLVARLADHVLAHGMASTSLRPLAAAVGTSDRMLLYYFADKAELIGAVLADVAARMTTLLDAHRAPVPMSPALLEANVMQMLTDPAVWPYLQLWLEIASLSARGDTTCRHVGENIARGFVAWLADQLESDDSQSGTDAAVRLLMSIEGAVLLTSLGLGPDVHRAVTPPSRPARPG